MARPREPINLIVAKGRKHLTKTEINDRQESEVQPCTDDLTPPSYLTAAEKRRFEKLAGQIEKLGILGETDTETLGRYVSAQTQYEKAVKELRRLDRDRPKREGAPDDDTYFLRLDFWTRASETAARLQDRYFKQAQTAAASLGLTISSRCKLVVPAKDDEPPVNKFSRFRAGGA